MKLSDLRKLDRDDLLKLIGLEEHTPGSDFFAGLGLFAVGVLVGAGLGVLFAPKRGHEMREQVGDMLRRGKSQVSDYAQNLGAEAGVTSTSPRTGGPSH